MDDQHTVRLRPSASATVPWALVGGISTALALWVALDAGTSLLAWLFAGLCVVATSYVLVQVLVPGWFTVVLDRSAIDAHLPWSHQRITWDRVHIARVVRVLGEPVLELHVWDPDRVTQIPRAVGILLPFGADLPALHRVLEERLGRMDAPPAGSRSRLA